MPGRPTFKELSRRWIEHTEVAKVLRGEWDLEPHNVYRLVSRGGDPPRGLTPTEHLLGTSSSDPSTSAPSTAWFGTPEGRSCPYGTVPVVPLIEHLRIVGQENRAS